MNTRASVAVGWGALTVACFTGALYGKDKVMGEDDIIERVESQWERKQRQQKETDAIVARLNAEKLAKQARAKGGGGS
eukprot:g1383.t1